MTFEKRCTLVATILGASMVFIDGTVVNVALPAIQNDLGGGLAAQQWVVDAYLLTLGSLILVGGSIGDIFGEARVFSIGVVAFGVASVLCGLAPDINTLIVFRGIQGVAGAILTPASLALITVRFAGEERGAAIGTWTAYTGISIVIGPLFGGWLIDISSWRAIFFVNVPIAIATLALALRLSGRHEQRKQVRIDYLGAILCVVGLGAVVFGFIEQPRLGWSSPAVAGTILGGAGLLAAFVLHESRTKDPMLPLRLFKSRNFSVSNIETLAVYGALSGAFFFLAIFLQQSAGWTPLQAGAATSPVTVVMFFLSRKVGQLSTRYGPRFFMAVGPTVAGLSMLGLARLPEEVNYWTDLLPPLLGFAFGMTLTVAPLTTTVLSEAGPDDAGIASGVNNAVARIAGLLAIALLGIAAGGALTTQGFHRTIAFTAAFLVLGGLIGAVGIRNPVTGRSSRSAGSPESPPTGLPSPSRRG
jgi:EmrB/QacA subfamily drug resistance transporter